MGTKLTKTSIDRLLPSDKGQVLYWDDSLHGFGIRVTPKRKTYFVEARVKGKTCRVTTGRHGKGGLTLDEAVLRAHDLLKQIRGGVNPREFAEEEAIKGIALADVFIDFKESRDLRPKTVAIYDSVMRRCFSDWLSLPITSITKDMVEIRHKELSNAYGPRGKGEAQAHQAMRTLRAVLNYAAAKYEDSKGISILTVNPVKRLTDIRAWNRIPRRQSVIHAHQLTKWAEAVIALDNTNVRDYLLLLLFTGLRRNEAASLKWTDIDFDAKALRIGGDRTKNHRDHGLPLSAFVLKLLKSRDEVKKEGDLFVFPGDGATKHLVEPKQQIKLVIKNSGIQFMSHDLRRTFLTIAESLDVSHYALKRLANHLDSSDVTSGYIVNGVDRLREPMDLISKFLVEKSGLKLD
jgi:integrase